MEQAPSNSEGQLYTQKYFRWSQQTDVVTGDLTRRILQRNWSLRDVLKRCCYRHRLGFILISRNGTGKICCANAEKFHGHPQCPGMAHCKQDSNKRKTYTGNRLVRLWLYHPEMLGMAMLLDRSRVFIG